MKQLLLTDDGELEQLLWDDYEELPYARPGADRHEALLRAIYEKISTVTVVDKDGQQTTAAE